MYQKVAVSPRIQRIRDKRRVHDSGNVILCAERTDIYTRYYKAHEAELAPLKRAGALYAWCRQHEVRLEEDEIFVANLGRDWRSAHPYVEWGAGWLEQALKLPEKDFIRAWQSPGAYAYISPEDRIVFEDAVSYWRDRTIQAHVLSVLPNEIWALKGDNCTTFGNRAKMFTANMPQGHYCPNYRKVIDIGWNGIIREAQTRMDTVGGRAYGADNKRFTTWRSIKRVADLSQNGLR